MSILIQPSDLFRRREVRRVSVDPIVTPRTGLPFAGDPEITLTATAWASLRQHAESDPRIEVGGLLIGAVFNEANRTHVVVGDAIPAGKTVADIASVVFTLATWERLLMRKAAEFGGEAIVGWYHTHPGFGVFLSSRDVFLHRSFFSRPWHLALVIDPVGHSTAFFLTTPETVIQRDDFNFRLNGSELWGRHLADSHSPAASSDKRPITKSQLHQTLQLRKAPIAMAVSSHWVCAVTSPGGFAVKRMSHNSVHFFHLPRGQEVDGVAFDETERLYILSREDREIWRLDLSKGDELTKLTVEGYVGWETSLPAGLTVVQRSVALVDSNHLLLFEPNQDRDSLKMTSEIDIPGVSWSQVLGAGSYQLAASGSRLFVNMPGNDAVAVFSPGPEPTHAVWRGAETALRSPLAIAASPHRVFALDTEGARIVQLNLNGQPQQEYLLDSVVRDYLAAGLVATAKHMYLAVQDGIVELELPSA